MWRELRAVVSAGGVLLALAALPSARDARASVPLAPPADSAHGARATAAAPAADTARGPAATAIRGAVDTTRTLGPIVLPRTPAVAAVASRDTLAARAASRARGRVVDYLWVVRTSLLDPAEVPRIVASAESLGARGLLVQVVGRGDAYYRSDLLPRAEALAASRAAAPDFDPLGALVAAGHAAGLEVHAWMNCMLVWSAPKRPTDPRHVVNEHPEWIARSRDGRRLSEYGERERRRLRLEGVFLAPGHPAVRHWLATIAREIAARYAVDGIHLDYIRQPGVPIGFDPTTRARFALETGIDPQRLRWMSGPGRLHADSLWADFQRAQVTAAVREVRDSLERVRPGLALSAAVLADTLAARRDNDQAWTDWLRTGLIDRAFTMCYAPTVQVVFDQLASYAVEFRESGRVTPGFAVYNTTPSRVAEEIQAARTLGFPTLALYSYDSLQQNAGYAPALRGRLDGRATDTQP